MNDDAAIKILHPAAAWNCMRAFIGIE